MAASTSVDTRFSLDEATARSLAERFGTPLYVVDERHFRARIRRFWAAFRAEWPDCELTFASKANSTLALLAIAAQEGCLIDVASEGELRAAMAAGVAPSRCHLHGNNKSRQELEYALSVDINQIVVDNLEELRTIATFGGNATLVLRLAPGVDPVTHAKISTGQADTKFGFNIADGAAEEAVRFCLGHNLKLVGYHCHVGSQLLDAGAQISGGEILAQFSVAMRDRHGFSPEIINVGGGLGVRYTDADEPMDVEAYCRAIVSGMRAVLEPAGLHPTLCQEPGRSLIAESGVTLYRVGVRKTVPSPKLGERTYLCVDGGLSDNPRPVMYGSKYTVRSFRSGPTAPFTISGKHCETDMLFEQVPLPESIEAGDLVQVLTTGAYNASMANNYNRYPRPATALIRENGEFDLVQRRDSWEEMFARETVPGDLKS